MFSELREYRGTVNLSETKKAPPSRRGTGMPHIGRIFTGPCASVFHSNPYGASAFICVHLRLIFDRDMQKIGSGMGRMRIICDEQNCPCPEVDYTDTHFYLNFKPSREYLKMSEAEKPEVGWENELNKRQKKAIDFVREKGKITNSDYRNLCNVDSDTSHRNLRELVERNILMWDGSGRSTYYRTIVG